MGNFINGASSIILENKSSVEYKDSLKRLDDYDYAIYYIGNNVSSFKLPLADAILFKSHLTMVTPGSVSSNNMPVPWEEVDISRYDADGNLVEVIKGRTYPKHMMIIIDPSVTLEDKEWETVRQCVIDNKVPAIIFGAENVLSFKDKLLWYDTTEYVDNLLILSANNYKNNYFEELPGSSNANASTREYVNNLIDKIIAIWGPAIKTDN